jgi:hypothetical protein
MTWRPKSIATSIPCRIAERAVIILLGDWNVDPFEDKGRNKTAFRKMLTHPRLELVRRPKPTDWTRPASRSHIDNIFISKNLVPKTTSQLSTFKSHHTSGPPRTTSWWA